MDVSNLHEVMGSMLITPSIVLCDVACVVQVLSPVKGSQIGTEKLNFTLQQHFNPAEPGKQELMTRRSFKLRVGDKVTHLKNDTLLDVYNGDQGFVESVDPQQQSVTIRYPSRRVQFTTSSATGTQTKEGSYATSTGAFHMVTYQGSDIDNMLQLAWATTVHKVGASEQCKSSSASSVLCLLSYANSLLVTTS